MDRRSTASSPRSTAGRRLRVLCPPDEAGLRRELREIGVDPGEIPLAASRGRTLALRLDGVPAALAALTARELRALGGEAALSRGGAATVLLGTPQSLRGLRERLQGQPGEAAGLAGEIAAALERWERRDFVLRLGGRELRLGERTHLMGILNVTPDSFSDGGRWPSPEAAVEQGLRLAEEGADIIDVGGESTRPGADPVPAQEEARRVVPVIARLAAATPVPISVDTTKAEVARAALGAGAALVNDVSGLRFEPELAREAARAGAGLVLMHMRGEPRTMQQSPAYADLMGEIVEELRGGMERAAGAGVDPEGVVVDPGIGFGKTAEHNLHLLARLAELRVLGRPVLVGPSRKSFIGRILDLPPGERVEGTIAACCLAAAAGAHLVRVHDVGPVRRALRVADAILRGAA